MFWTWLKDLYEIIYGEGAWEYRFASFANIHPTEKLRLHYFYNTKKKIK